MRLRLLLSCTQKLVSRCGDRSHEVRSDTLFLALQREGVTVLLWERVAEASAAVVIAACQASKPAAQWISPWRSRGTLCGQAPKNPGSSKRVTFGAQVNRVLVYGVLQRRKHRRYWRSGTYPQKFAAYLLLYLLNLKKYRRTKHEAAEGGRGAPGKESTPLEHGECRLQGRENARCGNGAADAARAGRPVAGRCSGVFGIRGEAGQIGFIEPAPVARCEIVGQGQSADDAAMQGLDVVARRGQHALDLMVLAFGDRQP